MVQGELFKVTCFNAKLTKVVLGISRFKGAVSSNGNAFHGK
jgi:hypothetical protein